MQTHTIPPVYDENSRVLILGSFPSVKSREVQFFYGHMQNRFWRVIAGIFGEETPQSIQDKTNFLLEKHIALWDVIESCEIEGSSDSSVKNVFVNDIGALLEKTNVKYDFKILQDTSKKSYTSGELENLIAYFKSRYEKLANILQKRPELRNFTKIADIDDSQDS